MNYDAAKLDTSTSTTATSPHSANTNDGIYIFTHPPIQTEKYKKVVRTVLKFSAGRAIIQHNKRDAAN